ncbi:geranylgeranyl reductase family protein [Nocardioides sp.]|uniref:geranylgeranyl reductase family protein n=1 Tax=Nocardioides sp. TaxID=35761 RepID=UPI003784E6EB
MTRAEGSDDPWDLVVVGAGPAGSVAALAALRTEPTLRVLLLDRAGFPRDKCCGDGIAPHVADVLRQVGAEDVTDGWTPVDRLELSRGDHAVEGTMARSVWVIPREVFDARLVEKAVAAGAVLRRRRVTRVRTTSGGVVLDDDLRARVVVGADGAESVVRSSVSGAKQGLRALAIRGYAPTPGPGSGRQVIRYCERRQPAYAWAFDRGDGWSNVGYGELVDRDAHERPTRALLLEQLDELLPGYVADGTAWRGHHLPLSGWRWDQPDGPVLLAGDAAGLVNPMTGEGIYYAVATGLLAGRAAAGAVAAGAPRQAAAGYRADVRHTLGRHLKHTWTASRLTRRPAIVHAGIRAAARDRGAFDDLVELGLGDGRITPRLATSLARALATTGRA